MRKRISLLIVIVLMGVAMPWGSILLAQRTPPSIRQALPHRQPAFSKTDLAVPAHFQREQSAAPLNVMIELLDEPTVQTYAATQATEFRAQADAAALAQLARIEQAQQALLTPLANMGARVLYRTQKVYNGIAVRVSGDKLAQLRQLPGVKAVRTLIPQKLDLTTSVPLIGAPTLWNAGGLNLTGDNKIGRAHV